MQNQSKWEITFHIQLKNALFEETDLIDHYHAGCLCHPLPRVNTAVHEKHLSSLFGL